jgi:hypothetical protein
LGKGQRRAHTADISKLHTHVNLHCSEGYSPPPSWLLTTASRMCPECDTRVSTLSSLCDECKNKPEPIKRVPRAQDLPSLQFNRVNQISLGLSKQALDSRFPAEDGESNSTRRTVTDHVTGVVLSRTL